LSALTSPDLLDILACPDCGGALEELGDKLRCGSCGREYDIKSGIPILFPRAMDLSHLEAEEELADQMKTGLTGKAADFLTKQWDESKVEFWSMVRDRLSPAPATIANIGCGRDARSKALEDAGYRFINLDIIHDSLLMLQDQDGAKRCVVGDICHLPFQPGSLDYLVCIDVIHHECDGLEPILASFKKLLKPGGILFLQDPNSWGMYQIWKSVMMPRFLHRMLRSAYHKMKRSTHQPAEYEFPTSVWAVKRMLRDLGFVKIVAHPHKAYPRTGPVGHRFYSLLARIDWIGRYHNYHYTITAVRDDG